MNIKAKKAYPIHNYFEREKEYIKSKRISFFMLTILFLVLVVINISFVSQKVLEVAKAEFLKESIETTEYIKINNQENLQISSFATLNSTSLRPFFYVLSNSDGLLPYGRCTAGYHKLGSFAAPPSHTNT